MQPHLNHKSPEERKYKMTEQNILEEIENWKLEAKLEDNPRYFYHTRIIDQILNGRKLYVIGRKGTGKTAITENLISRKEENYFAKKLTFKNFPFNKLYELEDNGYSNPNQYITLWKYVIYATTCKMLVNDKTVSFESREKLKEIFQDDIESALATAVERWTSNGFNISILGTGAGFNQNKTQVPQNQEWIAKVEILENFLQGELGAQKYIIVFDELDEDYKEIIEPLKYSRYTNLLTSLFKAAQDIRAKFSKLKYYPVICLRDDIYDILQDPDKTKWIDLKADLEWNEDSLKRMLAFRISRAIDPKGDILDFNSAWGKIVSTEGVRTGNRKKSRMATFDFICRSSFLRPRDLVRYIQVCAEKTLDKNGKIIKPETVSECDTTFSNYLRSELEDEIHGAIPDIHNILNIFTELRKQTIRIEEFKEAFARHLEEGKFKTSDSNFILQALFVFSVIGNQPKQITHQIFRYKNKDARLNLRENIIVHRGLFRSLQIL